MQLYKNGGVGALNDMGTQEAAVHAERWCWVVVTRKKGAPRSSLAHLARAPSTLVEQLAPTLSTYLDARLILLSAPTLTTLLGLG